MASEMTTDRALARIMEIIAQVDDPTQRRKEIRAILNSHRQAAWNEAHSEGWWEGYENASE